MKKFNELKTFDTFLEEQLKDPQVKAEYESLEPEFDIIRSILDARIKKGLTQKELSKITGISQADISRLENGNGNPTLDTIKRLAYALGYEVTIKLQPIH